MGIPDFHVSVEGISSGPFDELHARDVARQHPAAYVWRPSWDEWRPAEEVWPAKSRLAVVFARPVLALWSATLLLIFIIAVGANACDEKSPEAKSGGGTTSPKTKGPGGPSLVETISAQDYEGALAIAMPMMTDTIDEISPGAAIFGVWAGKHMKWSDVAVSPNETSLAMVKKDPSAARGKRVCYWGTVIQISKGYSDPVLYEGNFMTQGGGGVVNFLAAGSTGELVDNSAARICGVVTGIYAYSNVNGGQTQAVQVVGMFDLSENTR